MSRRRRSVVILLAVSCFLSIEIRAQESEGSPDPIKWFLKATPADSAKTIVAELTAEIQKGWHLYSTERVEGGPSPTRITLTGDQGLEISGEIDSPAPHSAYDPNFQVATESYEGSVTFKIPIKAQTGTSPIRIRIQVRYQTCTSTICLPPKLLDLETSLNGAEAKTGGPPSLPESPGKSNLLTAGSIIRDFDFTDFDGKRRRFSEFRGRVVLLDFWASWCSPCLADIPELKKIYQKFHAQGFEILGMDSETLGQNDNDPGFLKESQLRARDITGSRGVNWPQSTNETSLPVAKELGIESLPAKFLIDREGRFVARISKVSELDTLLSTLLKPKP
jgi:thiol-disulfide isomerase/thioredoxin